MGTHTPHPHSTATADYGLPSQNFFFVAFGSVTNMFLIPTTPDMEVEGSEVFVVSMNFSSEAGDTMGDFIIRPSNRQATVIIQEAGGNDRT